MSASVSKQCQNPRVFVEMWAPARLRAANSAVTAMIYHLPRGAGYLADIRRAGELMATITAPTLAAIRTELGAQATVL